MATIASAERLREAFQIPFRKDYFLGQKGWCASSGKNADGTSKLVVLQLGNSKGDVGANG
jgi:hypothetical protein